jgi:hypothetical protein
MWIATEHGFYSAVENRNDKNTVMIRARVREDLEHLVKSLSLKTPVVDSPNADYPYRVTITKKDWGKFLSTAGTSIDYPNFKSRVGKHDREREHVYHEVWATLMKLEKGRNSRWHYVGSADLLPLDEAGLRDGFDPDEPYLCQFCDETLVGFYEECPWCGEELWDYEDVAQEETLF